MKLFLNILSAYLRLLFNFRIFHGPDDLMGGSDIVSYTDPMISIAKKVS